MLRKVAKLEIIRTEYCSTEIIKALETNGFKVIVEHDGVGSITEDYIIAKEDGDTR